VKPTAVRSCASNMSGNLFQTSGIGRVKLGNLA
jgi:hypothetical protein